MLGHVNTQLTQLQRDEITPSLKAEYSAICSAEAPITIPYLFGDDLAKQLRDAKEASRISHSFASSSKSGPFKGNSKPLTNMTITLKVLKEIFCGKAKTGTTKRKNRQTPTRNNGTTASNLGQGEYFWKFPAPPGELSTNVMSYIYGWQVAAHFAAWSTLTSDKIILSDVLGAAIECTATPVQHKLPNQIFSEHEYHIVRQEVHKLLEKCVVTKVSPISGQNLF